MADDGELVRLGYNEATATSVMRSMPRFGASNSFANLFGTPEETTGYILGLLFGGLFLFSMYFTWTVILLLFKCLGQARVGFLSGHAFERRTDPQVTFTRPFWCRLLFLNASILFMLFSVLFVTQGLTNMKTTVTTVLDSTRDVADVMEELDALITDVVSVGEDAASNSAIFMRRLASDKGKECLLDEALQTETGTNFASLIASITDLLGGFEGNFQPNEKEELMNSTVYIQDSANGLEENVQNVDIGDWQSLIVIIPYIITPSFLMVGVCAAWVDYDMPKFRCLLSWLILPLFVLQVLFSYIASATLLIAASANADFCSGGSDQTPDGTVLEILSKQGWTKDDLAFQIVWFYVSQCAAAVEDPFTFLVKYEDQIDAVRADILTFAEALEDAANTALSDACDEEVSALNGLSKLLTVNLQKLITIAVDGLSLMQCSSLVTLYTNPVYNGTCAYSITGVTWAWASFAVVACMGLIMIMLRASWQLDVHREINGIEIKAPGKRRKRKKRNNDDGDDDDEDDSEAYGGYAPGAGGPGDGSEEFDDEGRGGKGLAEDTYQGAAGGMSMYGQLADDDDDDGYFGEGPDEGLDSFPIGGARTGDQGGLDNFPISSTKAGGGLSGMDPF